MSRFPDLADVKGKTLLDRVRARGRLRLEFSGETLTKGSFKESVDVNTIMRMFRRDGVLRQSTSSGARFEDLGSPIDYQEAMNSVISAKEAFASMPARLRERFGNDPEGLLRFLADPQNRDEATKLGLLKVPEAPPGPPQAVADGPKAQSTKGGESQEKKGGSAA